MTSERYRGTRRSFCGVTFVEVTDDRHVHGDAVQVVAVLARESHLVEEGQRFVFREGRPKGNGTRTDVTGVG